MTASWARSARNLLIAYGFMLPMLVLKIIYTFWPIAFGFVLAFADIKDLRGLQLEWVGTKHFERLFGVGEFASRGADKLFWEGLINSVKYIMVVPVIQVLSIGLAMLVNRNIPGIALFRAAYYIPVVTSFAVVGLMWGWMFNTFGPVNFVLTRLGLMDASNPTNLLNNPNFAIFLIMFVTLWKGLGYYMVLYLAGLQSIDKNLEEAAVIDGASRWQVFRFITLPGLRPVILVCSVLSTISAIKVFEEIFVMTKGSSGTYTAMYFVYAKAFENFEFGYAAAAGLVIAVVSLIFGVINFRLTRGGNAS